MVTLYQTAWTVENRFNTCPGDYADAYDSEKTDLMTEIWAAQDQLVSDPTQIAAFQKRLSKLDTELQAIFDRYDVYQIAAGGALVEPVPKENVNMNGAGTLMYGCTVSPTPQTAPLTTSSRHIKTSHGIGHHHANFDLGSSNETLIVGFAVTQDRGSHGGHWTVISNGVLLKDTAEIQIGSDYDRAADYTVSWSTVPTKDYLFGNSDDEDVSVFR